MIFQSEKTLGEIGEKVSADEKAKVQAAIDNLREAVKGGDTDRIKDMTKALETEFYSISEKLYKQDQSAGGGEGPQPGGEGGGTYEADYEDKTEK